MIDRIDLNNITVCYELQYKKVKNINLRIKPDGTIHISANKRVPKKIIDEFLVSKADFILNTLEKYKNASYEEKVKYFEESEICEFIISLCKKVYPYFEKRGVKYPEIKFRRMVSQWGNCRREKGILTFNKNLMYAPPECIEYVVLHEFTHFLQPNHSRLFYDELSLVCPGWKNRRKKLKNIRL